MSLRARGILAGLFWLLACIGVMAGTLSVWAHRSLLTADGWSNIMVTAAENPEVVAGTSDIIADRVAQAVGLEAIVADLLPGQSAVLAQPISGRVEGFVADGIEAVMGTEAFASAWERGNERLHAVALEALRGGTDVVSTDAGAIELNVMPVVYAGLEQLQVAGILPAGIVLPELEAGQLPAESVAQLEARLGRDLPDGLGTIQLVESENLAALQQVVRAFDIIVVLLIALTILFAALALFLAARRLRMVLWLALGSIVALMLARVVGRQVLELLAGSLKDGPAGRTIGGVLETVGDAMMWFTFIVIALAVVVAVAVFFAEWRGRRSGAGDRGPRPSVAALVRARSTELIVAGTAVIGFFALWRAAGPEIALMAAAGVAAWLGIIWFVSSRGRDKEAVPSEASTDPAPGPVATSPDASAPTATEA
jgi:hypothetical protein